MNKTWRKLLIWNNVWQKLLTLWVCWSQCESHCKNTRGTKPRVQLQQRDGNQSTFRIIAKYTTKYWKKSDSWNDYFCISWKWWNLTPEELGQTVKKPKIFIGRKIWFVICSIYSNKKSALKMITFYKYVQWLTQSS